MSRRARTYAEATAAKRIALLPVESEPEQFIEDGAPDAYVEPECWMCGADASDPCMHNKPWECPQ